MVWVEMPSRPRSTCIDSALCHQTFWLQAETGNCELCGKSQKLEWLRMHELKCKKDHEAKVAQLELQQAQDEATKDNDELGGKRRAAAK